MAQSNGVTASWKGEGPSEAEHSTHTAHASCWEADSGGGRNIPSSHPSLHACKYTTALEKCPLRRPPQIWQLGKGAWQGGLE